MGDLPLLQGCFPAEFWLAAMQQGKHRGHKDQRGHRRAHSRPPITARPSGAFCSPPSPMPSAIGTMPIIIARAVMTTGRKRVAPDSIAARMAS